MEERKIDPGTLLNHLINNGPEQVKAARRRWARTLAESLVLTLNIKGYERSLVPWLADGQDPGTMNNLDVITTWVDHQLEASADNQEPDIACLRDRLKERLDSIFDGQSF